jgi:hypothetical protein
MIVGKRKFIIAIFLGALAFTAFMFTAMDIACFGAFLAFLGAIVKLYNDANVKIKNGGGK